MARFAEGTPAALIMKLTIGTQRRRSLLLDSVENSLRSAGQYSRRIFIVSRPTIMAGQQISTSKGEATVAAEWLSLRI